MDSPFCQRCNSARLIKLSCEANDFDFSLSVYDELIPLDMRKRITSVQIGCLECGQLQGIFPKPNVKTDFEKIEYDELEEEYCTPVANLDMVEFCRDLSLFRDLPTNLIIHLPHDRSRDVSVIGIIEEGKLVEIPEAKIFIVKKMGFSIAPDAAYTILLCGKFIPNINKEVPRPDICRLCHSRNLIMTFNEIGTSRVACCDCSRDQ